MTSWFLSRCSTPEPHPRNCDLAPICPIQTGPCVRLVFFLGVLEAVASGPKTRLCDHFSSLGVKALGRGAGASDCSAGGTAWKNEAGSRRGSERRLGHGRQRMRRERVSVGVRGALGGNLYFTQYSSPPGGHHQPRGAPFLAGRSLLVGQLGTAFTGSPALSASFAHWLSSKRQPFHLSRPEDVLQEPCVCEEGFVSGLLSGGGAE